MEIQHYLAVLHRLVPQLHIPKHHLDEDDSDDEDFMEVDLDVRTFCFERTDTDRKLGIQELMISLMLYFALTC